MLTGQELVRFVKTNADLTETELAREAGYVRTSEAGKEQILVKQFTKALLEAQGVTFKAAKSRGKVAQYETSVHKNGIVLIGKTYTEKFGIEPGEVLKIVLEKDSIRLVPSSAA